MKRRLKWVGIVALVVPLLLAGGLWSASNQLLFPSWKGATRDLAVCGAELAEHWGKECGNLRGTHEFEFSEVRVPSINGYELPGWLIRAEANGRGTAQGAIMLIHGGGSDRRQLTKHIRFFLDRRLDVLTFDLGCHGEAPCPVPGLTYGHRESRDVLSAYLHLASQYDKVYAMGSSVGAASILVALPEMPGLDGVIAENPMASFQRLIEEFPGTRSMPKGFTRLLIQLTMLRGRFDGRLSPERSLPLAKGTPVYFVHSMRDGLVPYQQTQALAEAYSGPKATWFPDKGDHGAIWDADREDYEQRLAGFLDRVM
ncbi:alpha/beta hydrolase [Hyalangium gracile]|uniref:alpha/beta hydrolase n=1 Tax=Hyalangium gracile TaxID=394092 RepID=UPI001CCEC8B4|nr:alpha/beta fold hydrolase [Hyalangium gracile]